MKTIGVVIPIYNVEKYLRECLDSVINQSYTNLEIILVNDGSTDENSLNIAKEYTLKDKRITLFDKKNGGQSTARNVGIEYFSGEYKLKNKTQTIKENSLIEFNIEGNNPYEIYTVYKSYKAFNNEKDLTKFTYPIIDYIIFLDSDDYWELNCIEECVPRMDGVEVVWFDYKFLYNEFKPDMPYKSMFEYAYISKECIINSSEWKDIILNSQAGLFWFGWHGMIRFPYLKEIKLKFINGIIHEDHHFGIVLFALSKLIYIYYRKVYIYRVRSNSTCNHSGSNEPCIPSYLSVLLNCNLNKEQIFKYNKYYSYCLIYKELDLFFNMYKKDIFFEILRKRFLPIYKAVCLNIFDLYCDPLNIFPKLPSDFFITFLKKNEKKIENLNGIIQEKNKMNEQIQIQIQNLNQIIKNKEEVIQIQNNQIIFQAKYGMAKSRIKNQLSYKLGQTMIINSKNISGVLFMPVYIISTLLSHRQEKKIYQEKIKKDPSLKLPPLESYPDYKEALKEKECLTYKLGEALIKASNNWYGGGYIKLLLEIRKLKKEFKKK
ncbi:TPA: glycosyltransferase family 2 protein [Campylobacter jejuni]|nr:glycosyltransferase family 2 protein [Campylobacter jejuni]